MNEKDTPSTTVQKVNSPFSFFGRVEWSQLSGKGQDGTPYYRTKIVGPSNDPYGYPPWLVITSQGQFAKPGQETTVTFSIRGKSRNKEYTDEKTGEVITKTFYSHDLWLDQ
ncbi:MAG: hypothetical protein PHI97_31265 [Desulfobulbus sp.]|nr:hypothetical protein [Desulfobulbus sp.]